MDNHRIPTPADELKERVLQAAHEAWQEGPTANDISWPTALLRLAACLAAAFCIIALNQTACEYALAEWMPTTPTIIVPGADTDQLSGRARLASYHRITIDQDFKNCILNRGDLIRLHIYDDT